MVLLGGEPGSGKTRLVREFARSVAGDGVLVLYGACDAVVRTPYGPFVEALDHLARVTEPPRCGRRWALGWRAHSSAPGPAPRIGELAPPVNADPDTERHRLHMAVARPARGCDPRAAGIAAVLEDGHWADASTLLLLRHLARAAGDPRVLLLATFRDTEADVPESLSETFADLRRSDDVVRLRIEGLPDRGGRRVRPRRRRAARSAPSFDGLAQAIRDLTGGNAFSCLRALARPVERRRAGR